MRVGILTLGCDKNTVDNEYLAGLLERTGCEPIGLDPLAMPVIPLDAVVVATCGFMADAREQSIDALVKLADLKTRTGNPRRLFVSGCLSQRHGDQLMAEIPEIDGLVGVGRLEQLTDMIRHADRAAEAAYGAAERRMDVSPEPLAGITRPLPRRRLDARPYAFLKIADGCHHACAFCSIPLMKGRFQSVPPEILIDEAKGLLGQGVRELNLVAQDVAAYGSDLGKGFDLARLLRDLCRLEGDFWIRCLYCYPGGLSDALLETIAGEPKIVPYLDVPLQHLDPAVLRRMRRPCHEIGAFELVERLRRAIPGLVLRTTMMVGFPGETPAAHRRLIEGLQRLEFDRLGVFQFSREDGTPGASMPRQVGRRARERRRHEVMEAAARISRRLARRRIGQTTRVLVEGYQTETGRWFGRSPAEAPEVDGLIFVESDIPLAIGRFTAVRIIGAEVYDLLARRVEDVFRS